MTSRGGNEGEIILRNTVGGLPGIELERWAVSGLSSTGSVESLVSVTNVLLTGGARYWIEVSAGTEGTATKAGIGLHRSTSGDFSNDARQFDEGLWDALGLQRVAYRVTGTIAPSTPPAVPLPAGAVLLPAALVLLGSLRRRRKADHI